MVSLHISFFFFLSQRDPLMFSRCVLNALNMLSLFLILVSPFFFSALETQLTRQKIYLYTFIWVYKSERRRKHSRNPKICRSRIIYFVLSETCSFVEIYPSTHIDICGILSCALDFFFLFFGDLWKKAEKSEKFLPTSEERRCDFMRW